MTAPRPSIASQALRAVLLGSAVLVTVTVFRLVLDGRKHMAEALRLIDVKDRPAAVVALEDAAKAYVPGSPYPTDALHRLGILARGAEMRGERDEAIHIWEVMRRSVQATRHFAQPNRDYLAKAEQELDRLRGDLSGAGMDKAGLFTPPQDPDPWGSILLFLGLGAWMAGAAALCLGGGSGGGKPLRNRTYAWITCLAGLALWLLTTYLIG